MACDDARELYEQPKLRAAIATLTQRWPEAVSHSAESPIFVLAAGWRSGSTLLQRMLCEQALIWGEPYGHAGLLEHLADPLRSFTAQWPEPNFLYQGENATELSSRFVANLYPQVNSLLTAQLAWFDAMFKQPAASSGLSRWGIKEVRLSADHAFWLRWLYPQAKFIFLYRNPYDAYRSLLARQRAGWKWFQRWPQLPLTVARFGRHWRELTSGFLQSAKELQALVLNYDQLVAGDLSALESYLGFKPSYAALQANPSDGGPPAAAEIPESDLAELRREVEPLASQLGFQQPPPTTAPTLSAVSRSDSRKSCVVLVPVGTHIEPGCESALQELERRGYAVWRVRGYSAIDQGRNQMATDALSKGFAETMWIDSDVAFNPDDVDKLRAHGLPLVCGIYPKKGKRELAVHVLPGTQKLLFGSGGGLAELKYAATGFLHVRKEVYDTLREKLDLPTCNRKFGSPMVPYFQPLVVNEPQGPWYLAEDFAFSERARQCGFRIMTDTSVRLYHVGSYSYSWEEAGMDPRRYATFEFHLG